MSTRVSLEGDEYIETFNGEDGDPQGSDTYGIRIGELSIDNITPKQMVRLAQAVVNHLIICGHRFELKQLRGEYHDSLEVWEPSVPDMPNIPPPPPKRGYHDSLETRKPSVVPDMPNIPPPPPPKKDAPPINDTNRCIVDGVTYVAVPINYIRGWRGCVGCVGDYDTRMCDRLPNCFARIWKKAKV